MVKNKKFGRVMIAGLTAQLLLAATPIQAATLDQLSEQEQKQQQIISDLEVTIADKLSYINEKKVEVDNLQAEVAQTEEDKQKTTEEITLQKELIAARKEQLEARLVALQVSPSTTNRIMMLFDSENFTDFVGRFVALAQIQSADKERIVSAIEEEEKLKELEETLAEQVVMIKEKTSLVETELAEFDQELENLQILMADNQESLNQILTKKENEKVRLEEVAAAEKIAAEKAAAAEQAAIAEATTKTSEAPSSNQTTQSSSVSTPVVEKKEQPAVEAPASTNGRTLSVSATAYSRHEAGLSNFTATGIDLRQNSMVIAVDPNVIPLGSLLDVPGYGIAIAGDTGGAIIGNKIDLHMEDVGRMNAFGRQQITITILN